MNAAPFLRELAPMSGVTDFPFRSIVRKLNPGVVLYSEFTHVKNVSRALKDRLFFEAGDQPFVAQLFGNDPNDFREAAPKLLDAGIEVLDVNMGCPKAKLANSMHGSGLMKEPDLACRIIEAAVNSGRIRVTVKTRVGWENPEGLIEFGKKLERAGISQITVHGRTYKQKFKGEADWGPIHDLKRELRVPVVGNGDVRNEDDGLKKKGNLDGYMLGRGSIGNPWAFWECGRAESVSPASRFEVLATHFELCAERLPARRALTEFRKHLKQYLAPVPGGAEIFKRLLSVTDPGTFLAALESARNEFAAEPAAGGKRSI